MTAALFPLRTGAQFAVDWFTLDGGGGTSLGGGFALDSAIGQNASPAPLHGGNYSLETDFIWLFNSQTVPPPLIAIRLGPANSVVFSWPFLPSGFILQEKADLFMTNWTTTPLDVTDHGNGSWTIPLPAAGSRFYRLFKP